MDDSAETGHMKLRVNCKIMLMHSLTRLRGWNEKFIHLDSLRVSRPHLTELESWEIEKPRLHAHEERVWRYTGVNDTPWYRLNYQCLPRHRLNTRYTRYSWVSTCTMGARDAENNGITRLKLSLAILSQPVIDLHRSLWNRFSSVGKLEHCIIEVKVNRYTQSECDITWGIHVRKPWRLRTRRAHSQSNYTPRSNVKLTIRRKKYRSS